MAALPYECRQTPWAFDALELWPRGVERPAMLPVYPHSAPRMPMTLRKMMIPTMTTAIKRKIRNQSNRRDPVALRPPVAVLFSPAQQLGRRCSAGQRSLWLPEPVEANDIVALCSAPAEERRTSVLRLLGGWRSLPRPPKSGRSATAARTLRRLAGPSASEPLLANRIGATVGLRSRRVGERMASWSLSGSTRPTPRRWAHGSRWRTAEHRTRRARRCGVTGRRAVTPIPLGERYGFRPGDDFLDNLGRAHDGGRPSPGAPR